MKRLRNYLPDVELLLAVVVVVFLSSAHMQLHCDFKSERGDSSWAPNFPLANQMSLFLYIATLAANRNISCEEAEDMALRIGCAYRRESVL